MSFRMDEGRYTKFEMKPGVYFLVVPVTLVVLSIFPLILPTTLRSEVNLGAEYPLIIQEVGLVNTNSLMLKIANKSKATITIPLESGFPDYSSNSNCLLLRIRKTDAGKEDVCGAIPMQTTLVIPPLSSALVIVQATKQALGLHKNDEIEVAIDNTSVAVGFSGADKNKNTIHHGWVFSGKIKLLDGLRP